MTTTTRADAAGVLARVWRLVLVGVVALAGVGAGDAAAQTAPAGNAHPESRLVSEAHAANPFGGPRESAMSVAEKKALAAAVNLDPLRDLAVFHNGRVKILDTLARETVRAIAGRKTYYDLEPVEEGGKRRLKKVQYDPLFTMLDMAIDPGYYRDKAAVHVNYLPLREAIIEQQYQDPDEQEWWKRQGRLEPVVIARNLRAATQQRSFDPSMQKAVNDVLSGVSLLEQGWQNLMMIAPEATHQEWLHLSARGPETPIGAAVRELGEAWRAGDAAGVNAAAATLAELLPAVNPEMYPGSRRGLEAWYNRSSPFEYGYWLYFLSLVSLLLAFGTGRKWLRVLGVGLLLAAVGLHGAGFAARCIIAERFAIQNQYESMTGLSLFATLVGLGIMLVRRQYLFGAAAAGVGFMVLITATQTGIPGVQIEREAAILNTSVLLKYHVTTVLVSYGLISLGFITSLFYLGTYYANRVRGAAAATSASADEPAAMVDVSATALGLEEDAPKGISRVLSDLDTAQMIVLQLAFWALGVGILLGAWWADHSWGRWWAFDPKELWALVTWIVYLIVIHLRFTTGRNRGLVTAWLSVVGFFVMLWCYFGVNLLLPGLHAYA